MQQELLKIIGSLAKRQTKTFLPPMFINFYVGLLKPINIIIYCKLLFQKVGTLIAIMFSRKIKRKGGNYNDRQMCILE